MKYNYIKILSLCIFICCLSCKKDVNNQQEDISIKKDTRDIIYYLNEDIINDEARNYFNQGLSLINIDKYEESEFFFNKANELEPNNIVILDVLANLERKIGSFEKASKMYQDNIEQHPNFFNSHINYAGHLADNKEYQKAIEILNIGEDYLPNNSFNVSIYYLDLAFYYMNINECTKANECVNKSLRISNTDYVQDYGKRLLQAIEINCNKI